MNLIKSTGTFGFFTIISRLLGYLRDILIAIFLGAGFLADAFFVAFRIPNTFRRLFAEGTFNAAFVPSYAKELTKSKKNSENIQRLIDFYKDKTIPKMPVGAEFLMEKFNIPEGKQLGAKLKIIEEEWVKNNFQISDKQVSQIVNN